MKVEAKYPEIESAGGLMEALDSALRDNLSSVDVLRSRHSAGGRTFSFSNARYEHLYLSAFWDRGVELIRGRHAEIEKVARVVDDWLGHLLDVQSVYEAHPDLDLMPWSLAYSESPESFAAACWQALDFALQSEGDSLAGFTTLALRSRELVRFRPFTSMGRLFLSRTTGYPFHALGISFEAGENGKIVVRIGSHPERGDYPWAVISLIEREISHIPSLEYGRLEER